MKKIDGQNLQFDMDLGNLEIIYRNYEYRKFRGFWNSDEELNFLKIKKTLYLKRHKFFLNKANKWDLNKVSYAWSFEGYIYISKNKYFSDYLSMGKEYRFM